jgi:elongation factor 1-beta
MSVRNAALRDLIKMARVVITLKIMPESPDVNLEELEKKVLESIKKDLGDVETKVEKEEIGFGLNSLKVMFVMEEEKGSADPIADKIGQIEGVSSAEVVDARRAIE